MEEKIHAKYGLVAKFLFKKTVTKSYLQGDSGGPLVCDNELTGIVSWSKSCAEWFRPGLNTDVSKYITWIFLETRLMGYGQYMPTINPQELYESNANQMNVSKTFLIFIAILILAINE